MWRQDYLRLFVIFGGGGSLGLGIDLDLLHPFFKLGTLLLEDAVRFLFLCRHLTLQRGESQLGFFGSCLVHLEVIERLLLHHLTLSCCPVELLTPFALSPAEI